VHRGASIIPAGDRRIDRPAQIGQRRENFMPRRAAATLPTASERPRANSIGRSAAIEPRSNGASKIPKKSGAGEGIRTLDPNLGKVVLYP
jgi:hypothetical protein